MENSNSSQQNTQSLGPVPVPVPDPNPAPPPTPEPEPPLPEFHVPPQTRHLTPHQLPTTKDTIGPDAIGIVRWFDHCLGYGFIIGPDKQDVMVHYTAIPGSDFRALEDGSTVRYTAVRTPKGWRATFAMQIAPPIPKRSSPSPRDSHPPGHPPAPPG